MSHTDYAPAEVAPLFDNSELREFAAEDAKAATVIGKLLSTLFVYTLVAMTIVIWWSYRVID